MHILVFCYAGNLPSLDLWPGISPGALPPCWTLIPESHHLYSAPDFALTISILALSFHACPPTSLLLKLCPYSLFPSEKTNSLMLCLVWALLLFFHSRHYEFAAAGSERQCKANTSHIPCSLFPVFTFSTLCDQVVIFCKGFSYGNNHRKIYHNNR